MAKGINIKPSVAAIDPSGPRKRLPTMIDTLMILGPGRNCESDSTSVNSRSVTQRCCSTSIRRAKGSTPPKPCNPTTRKATKSARWVGSGHILANDFGQIAHAAVFMIGVAYAMRWDGHVRLDVLHHRMSRRARTLVDLAGTIFFVIPWIGIVLVYSWATTVRSVAVM